MKCLFVIDVQNGFVSDATRHVLPKIENLLDRFEGVIIATKFINEENGPYFSFMNWKHLVNSPEIDLVPEIENKANYIVEKNIYSACVNTTLELLDKFAIKEAYVVGIDTDCCVLKTATDLFEMDIRPIVLVDYCASNGGETSHNAAIRVMERTIGRKQIVYGDVKFEDI